MTRAPDHGRARNGPPRRMRRRRGPEAPDPAWRVLEWK